MQHRNVWWVIGLFLAFLPGSAVAVDYVSVATNSAVLYDAPSTQAKKLFVVNRHMPLEQVIVLANWVKVRDRTGGLYWVEKQSLGNNRYVLVSSPLIEMRAAADASSALVCQIRQQVLLERLESAGGGWLKVRHPDGETGYVRSAEVWGD